MLFGCRPADNRRPSPNQRTSGHRAPHAVAREGAFGATEAEGGGYARAAARWGAVTLILLLLAPKIPDPNVEPAISLGAQVGFSALLISAMVFIHAAGIVGTTKLLGLQNRKLKRQPVDLRAFGVLVSIGMCLFFVHMVEIALFAGFYLWVHALPALEKALYFSASVYVTLGQPDVRFPDEWRVLGASEGLVGFLLIGWSTAVFVTQMRDVLTDERGSGGAK